MSFGQERRRFEVVQTGGRSQYTVSGIAFTRHYGIDATTARRYSPRVVDGDLVVDLKEEGADATGPRARDYIRDVS